jgi:hypothetical protein
MPSEGPDPEDTIQKLWRPVYHQQAHYLYGPDGMLRGRGELPSSDLLKVRFAKEESDYRQWCLHYTKKLEAHDLKLNLMIWPEHCLVSATELQVYISDIELFIIILASVPFYLNFFSWKVPTKMPTATQATM